MISLRQLLHFTDQLSLSLKSGVPILRVFSNLETAATARRLRTICRGLRAEIEAGRSLGAAFRKYKRDFPEMFIALIEAGERTGHLDHVSALLADFYRSRYKTMSAMKWRLLLVAAYAFVLVNGIVFIAYVRGGWNPRVYIEAYKNIAFAIIYLILIPYVLYKNVPKVRTFVQVIAYSIPFLGHTLRKFCLSRFSAAMALGLHAGNEVRDTIRFSAKAMENPMLARKALKAIDFIEEGNSIAQSLIKTRIFPTLVTQMYVTGEESGNLFEMMERVASISREQAENALQTITTMFVVMVYLALIGAVGFMIVGLWTTLYHGLVSRF